MLHMLKIEADGFKMLADDFKLDLTSKARAYQGDKEKELIELNKGLYTFRSLAFAGGNSSGKSTVLSLILKTLLFLETGRWEYVTREFVKEEITVKTLFYLDGYLFKYTFTLGKIDEPMQSSADRYCQVKNEKLLKLKYDKIRGIKNIELIDEQGENLDILFNSSLSNASAITKITKNMVIVDYFNCDNVFNSAEAITRKRFFENLNSCDEKFASSIIKLFDENIEYIHYNNNEFVYLKREGEDEKKISNTELLSLLSSGTLKGIELFIRAMNALKHGKALIVDDIENCFQKNVVLNLLVLFNDGKINKNGAQLIFSTHYIEILDYFDRRDDIFITHKNNGGILVNNLYSDYNVRTELLKSRQFDNNVFNTLLNYGQLLEVRRNLLSELHINND